MRRTWATLLVLLPLAVPAPVQAQFTLMTNDGAITIIMYTGNGGSVTIPAATNGLPVTAIGEGAFSGSSLTSVTIPDSVTTIGENAFNFCTGLGNVTIPGSVIDIGEYAFESCTSLTNAIIADGVPSVGYGMFDSDDGLASVTIPSSVTSIAAYAFEGDNGLITITIPASVTSIGAYAFQQCFSLDGVYFRGKAPSAVSTVFAQDDNVTVYYLPGATGWNVPLAGLSPVLWDPLIQTSDGSFGVLSNQFGFNITNGSTNNIPIVVEACTNLASPLWTPLQSLTLTNLFYFSEPLQTNSSGRYYRISSP